jgi:methionine biosynthesis protein MetW
VASAQAEAEREQATTAAEREQATTAGYYDEFWSAQQERRYTPEPELRSLIFEGITSGTRCLDVGCGTGNSYAVELQRRGASYVGVDISAEAVERARAAGLDALVIADAAELPFAAESFDVVLCIEVLEHLFTPDQAVKEIHRVLRPGGRLVASAPNVAYWRLRANLLFGLWNPVGDELSVEQPWRDPHIRFFTPKTLRRMLVMMGFSTVRIGAHNGRLLDHLTSRPTNFGRSSAYAFLERRFPSLLGSTIHAVAVK